METKPFQLKLKIAWFKNFLGLAIDQVDFNQGYSLTPYYFWPKTEAWEQLKLELDSKLWLAKDEKVEILYLWWIDLCCIKWCLTSSNSSLLGTAVPIDISL